jgi:ABC-type molybdate transport system substrate-binding protein
VKNRAAAEEFIKFVPSTEGQAILKAHNFLPLK